MTLKYLDHNGLLYVWKKLKDTFVKKDEFDEVKNLVPKRMEDLENAVNYAKLTDLPKSVSDLVGIEEYAKIGMMPKQVSDLSDASNYPQKEEMADAIKRAVGDISTFKMMVVQELPTEGSSTTMYLISNSKGESDNYDEYLWLGEKFEKVGTTAIDLSGYLKAEEVGVISNEEIDALMV